MYILFLLIIPEDRIEHILRIGDLFCAFVADVAHSQLNKFRFHLLIIAAFQIPQHQQRKTVLSFQTLERIGIHAAC